MEGYTIVKKFENLNQEKQNRILNAAYEEFTKEGYGKASTNEIVKKAGIGKGMLFYYFKSKKELFNYLVIFGTKLIIDEYLIKIDEKESDFIEKLKQVSLLKMKAMNQYPFIFNFFGSLYVNRGEAWSEELESEMNEVRQLAYKRIYSNIDTTLFRDDIPADQVFKLINWSLEGYEKEIVERYKGVNLASIDTTHDWDEFFCFLNTLRKLYYK